MVAVRLDLHDVAPELEPRRRARKWIVDSASQPQLTARAVTPTAHGTAGQKGASVVHARGNLKDSCAQVERGTRRRRLVVTDDFTRVVAQLLSATVTPALDGAAGQDRTGVRVTGGEVNRSSSERDTASRSRCFIVANVFIVAVAEPAFEGSTPTAHITGSQNRTAMVSAGGDERRRTAQVHGPHRRRRFVVANVFGADVAECSVVADTPAANFAAQQKGTREMVACGQLNGWAAQLETAGRGGCFVVTHVRGDPRQLGEMFSAFSIPEAEPAA
jgi:hypothetical protein